MKYFMNHEKAQVGLTSMSKALNQKEKFYKIDSSFCEKCGNIFYLETDTLPSKYCPKCLQTKKKFLKDYNKHIFTLESYFYELNFYHHETTIVITNSKGLAIGKYVDNQLKIYEENYNQLKLPVAGLIRLTGFLTNLPFKLGKWKYNGIKNDQHFFDGFHYLLVPKDCSYKLISNINLNELIPDYNFYFTYDPFNQKKKKINLKTPESKNILEIRADTQEVLFDGKTIAYYNIFKGFLKKTRIVISWTNDVNIDVLKFTPHEVIKAIQMLYSDAEISFYDEKDLV